MSQYTMNIISDDEANAAYARGVREARRLRERARAVRRIADALDGAYITKRLDVKLRELFPDASYIGVGKDRYNNRKEVHLHPYRNMSYNDAWYINLHGGDDNRVDGEAMRKDADRNDAEAARKDDELTRLYSIICQYNALAKAYAGIYDSLRAFHSEIPGADWNFRRR